MTTLTAQAVACGSPEALLQGCACDPVRNHHGKGEPFVDADGDTHRRAYISYMCPIHSQFYKAPEVSK